MKKSNFIFLFLGICLFILSLIFLDNYVFILALNWLVFIFYLSLYTWRKIPISLFSYSCFLVNFLIFWLFITCILNLKKLTKPIYIEHLSTISFYRYTFFLIIILTTLLYHLIKYFLPLQQTSSNKITEFIQFCQFPHLKEEMRTFLYSWNDPYFGTLWTLVLDQIHGSIRWRRILFGFHFIFFYLIRLIQAILFANFTFLGGDLRLNLYLMPLSFLAWVLGFLYYYLTVYLEGTCNYIQEILEVTLKDPSTANSYKDKYGYFKVPNSMLIFKLTEKGYAAGFTDETKEILPPLLTQFTQLTIIFGEYQKKVVFVSYIIIIIRICCWISLSYNYFFF